MELKKGEKIIKKGVVDSSGVLYLTNQRLFYEYYPLFGMPKRTTEIPLKDVKNVNVEGFWSGRLKIECIQNGKPAILNFGLYKAEWWPDVIQRMQKTGDDWVSQIRKAAKLDVKKKLK
jgi:hypothetical protein